MRVVEPDVLRENHFILSSIEIFLSLLFSLRTYNENDQKSFSHLRSSLRISMQTIKSLNDFVMNRLAINISPKQDYNQPSFHRQKVNNPFIIFWIFSIFASLNRSSQNKIYQAFYVGLWIRSFLQSLQSPKSLLKMSQYWKLLRNHRKRINKSIRSKGRNSTSSHRKRLLFRKYYIISYKTSAKPTQQPLNIQPNICLFSLNIQVISLNFILLYYIY